MSKTILLQLLQLNANLRLAHWIAPTATNEHRSLGDLYDQLSTLTDELAEVSLGKTNDYAFDAAAMQIAPKSAADLLATGLNLVAQLRESLTAGPDDDLLAIVADMQKALNHARYFLKV